MKKSKKDNVVVFPSNLSSGEREVEAILFAAAEPLEIESIEAKVSKNINVKKLNSIFFKILSIVSSNYT